MSNRIILITGANGGLGSALASGFLDESPTNIVWLGVHRRHEKAKEPATANAARCRVVPLDVIDVTSSQQRCGFSLAPRRTTSQVPC